MHATLHRLRSSYPLERRAVPRFLLHRKRNMDYLGELEQVVVLAVAHLGDGAYGVAVRNEIRRRTGRSLSLGAVYSTLYRLEDKGYLSSWRGEPTAERGGRAKRLFRVEAAGASALGATRRMLERMWEGAELIPRLGLS